MTNQWFRLYHEFATDPKVQMLSEANQRRFIMLLCLRCSNDNVTFHDDEIAFQLRISDDEWKNTKAILIDKKLIDEHAKPIAWEKRQFTSDSSTARVAKYRAKKKRACNVSVTTPDTDTDTDTEYKETNVSCPEPEKSASGPESAQTEDSPENSFCEILLSGGKDKHVVTENDIAEYQEAYPGIDVRQEVRKCQQWNKASPTRRKTKAGIRRHISSWLGRAQDAVRPQPVNGNGGYAKTRTDRNKQACIDFVKGAPDAR